MATFFDFQKSTSLFRFDPDMKFLHWLLLVADYSIQLIALLQIIVAFFFSAYRFHIQVTHKQQLIQNLNPKQDKGLYHHQSLLSTKSSYNSQQTACLDELNIQKATLIHIAPISITARHSSSAYHHGYKRYSELMLPVLARSHQSNSHHTCHYYLIETSTVKYSYFTNQLSFIVNDKVCQIQRSNMIYQALKSQFFYLAASFKVIPD